MSQLVAIAIVTSAIVAGCWLSLSGENRMKGVSAVVLVMALISAPTINMEWARMTSMLVDDDGDSHNGLPDIWEGKQVICVHFPDDVTNPDFADGRHHVDYDGTDFMTDGEFNGTGACVGGFSGYEDGFDFMLYATNITDGSLEVEYSVSEWGPYVTSIGGHEPTGNAYWSLYHNGAASMVGIGDLVIEEDSVLVWQVDTW